jgi:hypothetical protein
MDLTVTLDHALANPTRILMQRHVPHMVQFILGPPVVPQMAVNE